MKRKMLYCFVVVLFLSLIANASDGRNRKKARGKAAVAAKAVDCNSRKLSKKARNACAARAARAAAEARRRAEEARRRAIAAENALRKTAAENIQKDRTEGEDLAIRQAVVNAIGNNAATAVVMKTKTGEIKTIVNQSWAINKGFAPCSTIKLLTTVAGLNQDVIDEEDEESQVILKTSLARSSNIYFQKLAPGIEHKEMIRIAQKLGLGRVTGLNVPGEAPGKLPLVKKTVSLSHGYGYEITPLQQAVMISTLTTHGKKPTPYINKKLANGTYPQPKIEQVDLPVKDLDGVIPGIIGAAEFGTARNGVDHSQGIAGKTGTCSGTGTFTSVAPISDPEYTVVVVIRGNMGKGKYAAAIAGKIYRSILGPTVTPDSVVGIKPSATPVAVPVATPK